MKQKTIFLALILSLSLFVPLALANHGGSHGGMCPMKDCPMADCPMNKSHECSGGSCPLSKSSHGKSQGPCPITNKFFEVAHGALEHKDEIGLTDEQAKTIKGLKLEMKKHEIRQMSEMQIMMLDLQAQVKADPFDSEAAKTMISTGFNNAAEGAKTAVDSYGQLLAVLKPEQLAKLKAGFSVKKAA